MSNLQAHVEELNQMVLEGKILEAFDKFYHDDIVMQENDHEPRRGKAANRQYEEQFVGSLEAFHDAKVKTQIVGENVDASDWFMDMTFKNGHRAQRDQVSVREWKDGKVIRENFYYAE